MELNRYLKRLKSFNLKLLPPKKQRTLRVASFILNKKYKQELKAENKDKHRLNLFKELIISLNTNNHDQSIDLYTYSEIWYEQLKPFLIDKRKNNRKYKKVFSLNDLKNDNAVSFSTKTLENIMSNIPYQEDIWTQVSACILTIPRK